MISGVFNKVTIASLAIAARAACSSGSSSLPAMDATQRMTAQAEAVSDLLYVSSQVTNEVYVYSYPQEKLVGTLTGFTRVYGLCSDSKGDVYVADAGSSQIFEYAHGGTKPIAALSDPSQFPTSCAVDPKTGNLAVTNYQSLNASGQGQIGDVAVYAHAQGTPSLYLDSRIQDPLFCGYDDKDDLFVDGLSSAITPSGGTIEVSRFGELPKGSTKFTDIKLTQGANGGIQWDGKDVIVGDSGYLGRSESAVNRIAVSGTTGKIVQTWVAPGAEYLTQFVEQGGSFIAADNEMGSVGIWKYGAIRPPSKLISGISEPYGVALSSGKE
jgi:hypothetical protein